MDLLYETATKQHPLAHDVRSLIPQDIAQILRPKIARKPYFLHGKNKKRLRTV